MKPSPSRRKYLPITIEANQLIKEYLTKQSRTTYLDVYAPMLDASGQIRGELFKSDSLHMNPKGYAVWTKQLKPLLK
jgi:lysophospholipase L1-like esterase